MLNDREYTAVGLLGNISRPNRTEIREYDEFNRLTSISNGNITGKVNYTYDNNHNKLSEFWTVATSAASHFVMSKWDFATTGGDNGFADGYDAEDRFRNFNRIGLSLIHI